ncbi:MAG: hypothetical protein K5860_11110 [Bacteroidales bacterium]|nr:hypothetical protein [Bacteroidales bacterium]
MIKYLYIDDDYANAKRLSLQFKKANELDCDPQQCIPDIGKQISQIKESNYSGVILDLRLRDKIGASGEYAPYHGTTLAQQIRTEQKEGSLRSFPVILFSANDKLRESMEKSDYNLFDYCISKDNNDDIRIIEDYQSKLIAIAEAYSELELKLSMDSLGIDESCLDERFVAEVDALSKQPKNVIVKFLITQVLEKQGALINEDVLFARLGIDKSAISKDDIEKIKDNLTEIKYRGILSIGWARWWAPKLEKMWEEKIDKETFLRSVSASDRVAKFSSFFNMRGLPVQNKIEMADSDRFWTVCKDSNKPLDPVDGFLVQGQDAFYPWQEKEYVSKYYAKYSENKDVWIDVAQIEKDRYNNLLKQSNNG